MKRFIAAVLFVALFAASAEAAGCCCKNGKCGRPAPVKKTIKWIRGR